MQTETFPTLYKRNKKGKVQVWSIRLDSDVKMNEDDPIGFPLITRSSGQMDGKINDKKQFVKKGTNIGRANEKSTWEHALFLANNMFQEKIEENFVDSLDKINLPPTYHYPMLAKTFNKKKTDPTVPAYAQPKLNGIRTWQPRHMTEMDLTVRDATPETMLSRKMHVMEAIKHIKEECKIFGRISPDGEIYNHGIPLQTIQSWSKKFYDDNRTESLEFWVFDLAIPKLTFEERHAKLLEIIPPDHPIIKIVPTVQISHRMEFFQLHDKWVQKGFEGAMWRSANGLYGFNDRPADLFKFKDFKDKEFIVTGWEVEEYHDQTTDEIWELVVWECEVKDTGKRFTVRPVGSMEKRRIDKMNPHPNDRVGQKYKVRYQELSEDGTPTIVTGRGFRSDEVW